MSGYGTTSAFEEEVSIDPALMKQRRITINCGSWSPDQLLGRLRDGGCPIRHCEWVHYDRSNTIQCGVAMTKTGVTAMKKWLRMSYVIPKELDINISPTD